MGAYQHEEQDAARFVEWGFDFLKYDWCSYGEIAGKEPSVEALQKPYRQMGAILKRQPRDIVLNLCQYGMGKVWEWGREVGGHSWRTAGDLGLTFEGIGTALFKDGFDVYADNELHRFGGPGAWNDPDYLLLGLPLQLEGRDRAHAAHAQRAVHARLALVARRRPAHLQRRRDPPRPVHALAPHQRRGDRRGPGPAREAGAGACGSRARSRSGRATSRTARRRSASSTGARGRSRWARVGRRGRLGQAGGPRPVAPEGRGCLRRTLRRARRAARRRAGEDRVRPSVIVGATLLGYCRSLCGRRGSQSHVRNPGKRSRLRTGRSLRGDCLPDRDGSSE